MADEERPTNGDGFDDWLDEEPGPDTDPYAALAADDAEAEIAEWMAFTEGDGDSAGMPEDDRSGSADQEPAPAVDSGADVDTSDDENEPDPGADVAGDDRTPGPDSGPGEITAIEGSEALGDADADPTEELAIPAPVDDEAQPATDPDAVEVPEDIAPATSVEITEFDGGGRPDTEEIPIIAGSAAVEDRNGTPAEPVGDGDALPADDPEEPEVAPTQDDIGADPDDTGEMPVVSGDASDVAIDDTGELHPFPSADDGDSGVFDIDEAGTDPDRPFSQDDYLATATREHAGLAAAIAEAETSETEQVALAAPIPGLETAVVGFEDVVEAEGHTKARARASGDLLARVVTGVVLIAAVGLSLFYRPALVALATVVFVIGAGEFYTALRRSGRQPIALFGFLGILGASVGGFVWGAVAIPMSFLLVAALLLLFYAVVPGKPDPMANLALTVTVMVWAGLGAYAMMIIDSDDFRPLVLGVVLTVALMDITQYFVGRALGRHPLSPWVSPKKTVEGLVGGVIVAFTLGALLHFVPPFELTSGLAVGAAVAVLSPLGDLAMSAAKRALGIKDMGSILPGHGGFMDRIDGLLFVIPAAWAIFVWAGLI